MGFLALTPDISLFWGLQPIHSSANALWSKYLPMFYVNSNRIVCLNVSFFHSFQEGGRTNVYFPKNL